MVKNSRQILIHRIANYHHRAEICFNDVVWRGKPILLIVRQFYIYIEYVDQIGHPLCSFDRDTSKYETAYIGHMALNEIIKQIISALEEQFYIKR